MEAYESQNSAPHMRRVAAGEIYPPTTDRSPPECVSRLGAVACSRTRVVSGDRSIIGPRWGVPSSSKGVHRRKGQVDEQDKDQQRPLETGHNHWARSTGQQYHWRCQSHCGDLSILQRGVHCCRAVSHRGSSVLWAPSERCTASMCGTA